MLIIMQTTLICRKCTKLNRCFNVSYGTFKMKKDQFSKAKKTTNSDRALEHFDLHYQPVYKDKWPSIRISLLTAKKMCAVMNNYALENKFAEEFSSLGAYDIIMQARVRQNRATVEQTQSHARFVVDESDSRNLLSSVENKEINDTYMHTRDMKFEAVSDSPKNEDGFIQLNDTSTDVEVDRTNLDRTNLYNFIPAEMVYSESQQLRMEEAQRSVFTPMDVKVDIVKPREITLPEVLNVMSFPNGDVTEFPDVKSDVPNGHLCFYLMDAASVFPVIALDLEKGDSVLDLCAAPGGKSLSILQTGLPERLTCNDLSGSRLARLQNILKFYIPETKRDHVTIKRKSGMDYTTPDYDKVLVDVPCNTDRHVLLDDGNNLFHPNRINERIELTTLQKDLLMSGIKSCRPGGCIVYSTCTLSPAQNDGVIQSTLDDLWRHTNIQVVIEDLREITQIFGDTFRFYRGCRFGQLVLPSLSSNYGPMYFCKIRRLS